MSNKNVLYVEPNYTNAIEEDIVVEDGDGLHFTNQSNVYDVAPSMEDYCVTVDLEVEIKGRNVGKCVTDSKVYTVTFSTRPEDGEAKTSFFEGKKMSFGNSEEVNYLTTNPTEFGTYEDAINNGTNECFGINSINIAYNNYMTPEVTIEFTDIRGISLFAPEELRHSAVGEDNIGGQIRSDVAGSFFKCFFTFPYPVFRLTVKGFYGEPVTYELCCSDFRARFDCNSGNFGATAKFVGYSFSLLNDVTMNALTVAPYSDYIGKEYWESNLNEKFTIDGKPMLTIIQILEKMKDIKNSLSKLAQTDPIAQKNRDLNLISQRISNVSTNYITYFNKVVQEINKTLGDLGKQTYFKFNSSKKIFALYSEAEDLDIDINCRTEYENLVTSIEESAGSLNFPKPLKVDIKFSPIGNYINELKKYEIYLTDKENENYSIKYVYFYNGYDLNDYIEKNKVINGNSVKQNQKDISNKQTEVIASNLGFEPSVENMTKIIMAHFETLIHSIYYCSSVINNKKRKASDIGISTTDNVLHDSVVPPFPRIDIEKNENGVTNKEEGWMGSLDEGLDEEEVNLIEGLLKGTNNVASTILEATKAIEAINGNGGTTTSMKIPLCPMDIMMDKNPFGENVNFNNLSDFAGRIGLRMANIFGLVNYSCSSDYEEMGKADAINFSDAMKDNIPSSRFVSRLIGGAIDYKLILDCLLNRKNSFEEKIDNHWTWDVEDSEPMFNLLNGKYYYSLYDCLTNENSKTILPIQNIDWNKIREDIGIDKNPTDLNENYFSTRFISKKSNKYIFDIDLSYKNYSNYKTLMQLEGKEFSYVKDLGLDFDIEDYLDEYFEDEPRQFAKTFQSDYNNKVNFKCEENSYLLPESLPSIEEASLSKSFIKGSGYDDDFDEIINNGDDIDRDKDTFSDIENDIEKTETFTIPTFAGIVNGEYSNEVSIFGQKEYYMQPNEIKALLFLKTFEKKTNVFFDDGCLNIKKICENVLTNDDGKHFNIIPYLGIVYCGGLLYLKDNKDSIIYDEEIITNNTFTESIKLIGNVREEIKTRLVEEFNEWVKTSFKTYQEQFELIGNNNGYDIINNIIKIFDNSEDFDDFNDNLYRMTNDSKITNFETYLASNLKDNFYKNYISIKKNRYGLKLFNRETASEIRSLTNLLVKPCMVITPTKYNTNNCSRNIELSTSVYNYIEGFLDKLKEIYKDYNNVETVHVTPISTDENIKITLYKYIKILWDKWLSGTKEKEWSLSEFFEKNWFFIDSFYNKIGQAIKINIVNFCSDILYSQMEHSYSLLSFLSKMYAKDRFNLLCVQNFMDLTSGKDAKKNMDNMFKPIPYEKINFNRIDFHPSFVVMYTYEYSSKLDMENSNYESDSFDISSDNNLPTPITSKTDLTGFKIPAFGVSYGRQYQSYFKNIDVSTDNPIVTEQSIKAQFMIASMNGKSEENGKNVVTLGQDLYTIYSNNSYTCTVTMMGCAWIQPLMYFQLLNVPMFRGAYLIQKVTHTITPGNMETTFIGTRMSAITTAKVNNSIVQKMNDETDPNLIDEYQGRKAEVTNDCEYKYFNPLIDNNSPNMSEEELDMTLDKYEDYIGHDFSSAVTSKISNLSSVTVAQLLGGTIKAEAESEDKLGRQLIATVLFNRYVFRGKDLTRVYYGKQHEIGLTDETCTAIAKEIFTQTPAILIGQKTSVMKQVPIWNKGIKSNELTSVKEITEHDVKSIDGYCTTNGYEALDKNKKGNDSTESYGWWQDKARYSLHHQTNSYGHVFVAGAFEYDKEYWQIIDKTNSFDEEDKYSLANSLYESIEKTIKYSNEVILNNISKELDPTEDNAFFIKANPSDALVTIFDIVLNTYEKFVSSVRWIVKNDASEMPSKIRIVASNDKNVNKIFAISRYNEINMLDNLNQYEGCNKLFYVILRKHYGVISTLNENKFKNECKNFSDLFSNPLWLDKVNTLLGNCQISSCGQPLNSNNGEVYSWYGDGIGHLKDGAYIPKLTNYNPNDSCAFYPNSYNRPYSKDTCGHCASVVRQAMMHGGANFSKWPNSACAYVDYMPKWGFTEVYSGFSPIAEGYNPIPGDIIVIAGRTDGKTSKHGHIQIFKDNLWWSDYRTTNMFCYSDEGRPFKVFRWTNTNNNQA